jgi:2-polyprenyl-6-methoxyphenol hydroxylase-like FAD-dependent oxidoreductase
VATELTADVVVVGAGPAGAATALMLGPFHRTLLVDRHGTDSSAPPVLRIGESLPAAARRLLRDMGLWQDFQNQGHAPRCGARSLWGGPEPVSADSIRDPDGPVWHLDRARFDVWLRQWASNRGAALVTPAQASNLSPTANGWRLTLTRHGRSLAVATRFVVDAGGRTAPVARALVRRRQATDRLVCRWCHGVASGDAGVTVTIAEPEGWWYTRPSQTAGESSPSTPTRIWPSPRTWTGPQCYWPAPVHSPIWPPCCRRWISSPGAKRDIAPHTAVGPSRAPALAGWR